MNVYALFLFAALSACQESGPPPQGVAETTTSAEPFSGRLLDSGHGNYGELSALRDMSGGRLRTVIAYRTIGFTDPNSGEDVAFMVSGVEVECDAGRMRYTFHQGRSASGGVLYQFALPGSVGWNSGDRIAADVNLLCGDTARGHPPFNGVAEFLDETAGSASPIDAFLSVTPARE